MAQRLRGPGFEDDGLGDSVRKFRPAAGSSLGDSWGFSTKARQVERDLGVK